MIIILFYFPHVDAHTQHEELARLRLKIQETEAIANKRAKTLKEATGKLKQLLSENQALKVLIFMCMCDRATP